MHRIINNETRNVLKKLNGVDFDFLLTLNIQQSSELLPPPFTVITNSLMHIHGHLRHMKYIISTLWERLNAPVHPRHRRLSRLESDSCWSVRLDSWCEWKSTIHVMKIALLPSGASCQGLIHEISVPTRTHTHKREMNMFPKLPLECCATLEIAFPQC